MREIFTLTDVMNSLIELESIGYEFYSALGEKVEDRPQKELLRQLAEDEKGHEALYRDMKRHLETSDEDLPLEGEYEAYIRALIDQNFFIRKNKIEVKNLDEAFDIAERLEKDTIFLLNELKSVVMEHQRKNIEKIIEEERSHLKKILWMR
ncbi:ferritin family protein [Thermotalea metallivorans]|uniref:Rubrerythrin diiron-binding domain-containing protein n=1 Tax=Thermotalea metallivorans TaxID=520762 RepID=A0A140L6D2_9FIRM|nr:ferritin family protein [Thermotalea metallivorans]KXG76107.1 hypothetical protein AN619_10640 [Thermotalea metallivorans]